MNMIKTKIPLQVFSLTLICCLLCACQMDKTARPEKSPRQIPEEQPFEGKDIRDRLFQPPQQVLEEQPTDDTHDAFLINTGGKLGLLLVTAELDERTSTELCRATVQFTIWNPYTMDEPLQTLTAGTDIFLDWSVIDANFDGYMDFTCTYLRGNQPYYDHLWIWNEELGLFEEVPEYDNISMPTLDEKTETIYGFARSSAAGTGEHTFHQWVEGNLLCMRRIEIYGIDQDDRIRMSIQDRIAGELTEIYHEDFSFESCEWFDAQEAWHDLDYHGEATAEN